MLKELLFALPVLTSTGLPSTSGNSNELPIAAGEMLAERRCDPNEDCSRCFKYPCPTFGDWDRECEECPNDPICLGRVEVCKTEILGCVGDVIGSVSAGCAVCLYTVGWGTALLGCVPFCGEEIEVAAEECT